MHSLTFWIFFLVDPPCNRRVILLLRDVDKRNLWIFGDKRRVLVFGLDFWSRGPV